MDVNRDRCVRLSLGALALASLVAFASAPASAGYDVDTAKIPARYRSHVRGLQKRLPKHFTIVVEPPFVVIGDEKPSQVKRRSERTVRWAVNKLKKAFFRKDPRRIIDVYLFRGDKSYRYYADKLFGDKPDTPYGYYSSRHRALIMNISTGGGTLVHEIVHPFVEADFPGAPPWLNEGLGSLFEASHERGGKIHGMLNWRLPGLQRAIRDNSVPAFKKLTALDENGFYNDDSGVHYAQARYLLFYLQERGLLRTFYRQMRRDHHRDPTGYSTLVGILGEEDMANFQKRWERWALRLKWR